jgi:hypothetical protein
MNTSTSSLIALGLALAPAAALAHDDHRGLSGLVHVVAEPMHLGLTLLLLTCAAVSLRLVRVIRRRNGKCDAA